MTWSGVWRQSTVMVSVALFAVSCSTPESPTAAGGEDDVPSSTVLESTTTQDTSPHTAEPDDVDSPAPDTASSSSPPDGVIEEVACDSNASCASEFWLNGRIYARSCGLIDPTQVDPDNQLGTGRAFGREIEAYALLLDPSFGIVAVSAEPGSTGCSEDPGPDAPTSPWQFAFGAPGSYDESLICELGLFSAGEAAENEC